MKEEKLKKDINLNIILKFLSIIISFYMIRITNDYLDNKELYGVWLTILSILNWVNVLDIGLGNGLRNKLIEFDDEKKRRELISTAYGILIIIMMICLIIFAIANVFTKWNVVFNINYELNIIMFILISSYLIRFVLNLINSIYYSMHQSTKPPVIALQINILIIILISISKYLNIKNFLILAIIYSSSNIIIFLYNNIKFFYCNKNLIPKYKFFRKKYIKELSNTGIKFFLIQIFNIIIFTTDSMIITKILGPESVVEYQITQKVFSVYVMFFGVILIPLWSVFTQYYNEKKYTMIKLKIIKLLKLFIGVNFLIIVTALKGDFLIKIWMGKDFSVSKSLLILMMINTILTIWFSIFSYVSNGIGRLNMQLICYIIGGILNIPLSIYFSKNLGMGVNGVIIATIICIALFSVLGPIDILIHLKKKEKIQRNNEDICGKEV